MTLLEGCVQFAEDLELTDAFSVCLVFFRSVNTAAEKTSHYLYSVDTGNILLQSKFLANKTTNGSQTYVCTSYNYTFFNYDNFNAFIQIYSILNLIIFCYQKSCLYGRKQKTVCLGVSTLKLVTNVI